MPNGAIVVVGSLNMDLVVRCAAIPRPGETVAGGDLLEVPGGKGANQAVAAARLAAGRRAVRMVGRVGGDAFGGRLLDGLRRDGVDAADVHVLPGVASGTAMILVDGRGENAIVVSPGANGRLAPADVPELADAAVVLLQLEIPLDTVAAAIARAGRAIVILDPAPVPADGLPDGLYGVGLITPNQTEAEALTGVRVDSVEAAQRAAAVLMGRGVARVIVKLGGDGCVVSEWIGGKRLVTRHVPGFAVDVVDSTAAGDSFNGALAVALAEGLPLVEAARFANAAGALACTRLGAQSSVPTRDELNRFFASGEAGV